MINHDFHVHTAFSSDSEASMESVVLKGIDLGLQTICFTEHMDMDFPIAPGGAKEFEVDTTAYRTEYCRLKETYAKDITLKFGIEIGLQSYLGKRIHEYINSYPFDFVIGSSHLLNGQDPYDGTMFKGHQESKLYREYFECELENVQNIDDFDVYGHLDYIVRYGPNKNQFYNYEVYADLIDEILKILIEKGKGIEINTSGLSHGLGTPHPVIEIVKRYHELGGEIITIGSDAHTPSHLVYRFTEAEKMLLSCGYRYYTIFSDRKPEFIKL
ncbi:MAG: histidinol-phosphatase HisJ family protein [Clostridia bacterium]|nr:histidinol-phosphatase HisJ family protein [Clostridia bacterium]